MAKKSFGKYLGKTIKRGVTNALTPGDDKQQSSEEALSAAISSNLEKIIESVGIDGKHKELVSCVSTISDNTNQTNYLLASIGNNILAITGALFGYNGITKDTNYKSLLSKIGNINNSKTIYAGICNEIKNIGTLLQQIIPVDIKTQMESIAMEIGSQINSIIKSIHKIEQGIPTKSNDTEIYIEQLNTIKESLLVNPTTENIKRIYDLFVEYTKNINSSLSKPTPSNREVITNIDKNIAFILNAINSNVPTNTVSTLDTTSKTYTEIKNVTDNILASVKNISAGTELNIEEVAKLNSKLENINNTIQNVKTTDYSNVLSEIANSIKSIDLSSLSKPTPSNREVITNQSDTSDDLIQETLSTNGSALFDIKDILTGKSNESNLYGNITLIYGATSDIKSNINELKKSVDNIQKPESQTQLLAEPSYLQVSGKIDINGIDSKSLEALASINNVGINGITNLESLANAIEKFSEISAGIPKTAIDSIAKVLDIFSKTKDISIPKFEGNVGDFTKGITDIITSLSTLPKIDKDESSQIYASMNGISSIFDSVSSLGKVANASTILETFGKTGFLDKISDIIVKVKDLGVIAEGEKSGVTTISDLMEAITNIGGFDKTKFKELSKNMRKLIRMTGTPSALTKIGFTSDGLFTILFNNIAQICKNCEGESDKVKAISLALKAISQLGKDFDEKETDNLVENVNNLNKILDKDEKYNLQNCISEIIRLSGVAQTLGKDGIKPIESAIDGIMYIGDSISVKDILVYQFKIAGLLGITYSLDLLLASLASFKHINKAKQSIEEVNSVLLNICSIDEEKIKAIDSLSMALKHGATAFIMTAILWSIGSHGVESAKAEVNALKELIDLLNSDEFPAVSDNTVKKITAIQSLGKMLATISAGFAMSGALALLAIPGVWATVVTIKGVQKIVDIINNIKIERDFEDKTKSILKLVVCSSIIILVGAAVGKFVLDNLFAIVGFTTTLTIFLVTVVSVINNIASKGIDKTIGNAEKIAEFIGICGGIMLIGGLIMTAFPKLIINSLIFAGELAIFLVAVVGAINLANKLLDVEKAKADMQQFADLIIVSAGVMLIGAMINDIPGVTSSAFAFVSELAVFIGLTLGIYAGVSHFIDPSLENAEKFAVLVGVSAASLLAGGALFALYPWMIGSTLLFGIELAAFVFGTIFVFTAIGSSLDEAVSNAEKFGILIGISAMSLCLGGFLFQEYPWMIGSTLLFGIELAAFVFGIVGMFAILKQPIEVALKGAKDLGIIIAISTASMLIGGAFMLIPGMWWSVLEFAAILAIFTGSLITVYGWASKRIKKSYQTALSLGALVFVTAATVLIGGYLFLKNPGLDNATGWFIGLTIAMVVGMSVIINYLGNIKRESLIQGEAALAGIAIIMWGIGKAMQSIGDAYQLAGTDMWRFTGFLALSLGVIVAVGTMVLGIAALTAGTGGLGAGAIAIAEGLLAGVVGIVWEIGKAMQAIGEAFHSFENIKKIKGDIVVSNISEFLKIGGALVPLTNPLVVGAAIAASTSVSRISAAVSSISKAVQDFANLTVNEYDENGRATGNKLKLGPDDFAEASANIATVITTIGNAIIEVYNNRPDIFDAGFIGNFLGMDTPFSRVVKSCTGMGKMISKISEGIKDYAELMIPVYDGTKKTGYRPLNDQDFINAANNIKKIISVVGGAILSLYYGKVVDVNGNEVGDAKELFSWSLIGDNPFAMVMKSCTRMGKMISSISKGIKDYAQLMMPIYDETGKVTGYRNMTDSDFESAAKNIGVVISTIGAAIIKTYNDDTQGMFTDPSKWHTDADKTPFGMVTKALSGTGKLISEAVKAIDDVNKVKLPGLGDPKSGLTKKVKDIVSCVAEAIMFAYGQHEEWFTDDSHFHTDATKTPFGMVRACLEGTGKIVTNAINSIKQIQALKLGKTLAKGGELYNQIQQAISIIPSAIMGVATKDGKIKDEYKDSEITDSIEAAFDNYLSIVKHCAAAYSKVAKLKLTLKEGEENSIVDLSKIVAKMIYNIPFYINTEYNKHKEFYGEDGQAITKSISESFDNYEDAIESVTGTYKTIYKSLKKLDVLDDTSKISVLTEGIKTMLTGSAEIFSLNELNLKDVASLETFVNTMSAYNTGISDLIDVFNKAPEDTIKYTNLQNAIDGVNSKIAEVKVSQEFTKQTKDLSTFVKSINSISIARVGKFTSLIDSLNSLGTKFDGLDKFTTVLATKMATTLKYLADQIKGSSEIINKADKIQEKRKKHIDSLIKEINSTLNTGLDITIYEGKLDDISTPGYTPQGTPPTTPTSSTTPLKPMFGGNTNNTPTPTRTTEVTKSTPQTSSGVSIDYGKLRTTIIAAIQSAGGSSGRK